MTSRSPEADGLRLTDDLDEATIIVGSQFRQCQGRGSQGKVQRFVAYTADALQFVKDYKLAGKFSSRRAAATGWALTPSAPSSSPRATSSRRPTPAGRPPHVRLWRGYIKKAPAGSRCSSRPRTTRWSRASMPKDDIKEVPGHDPGRRLPEGRARHRALREHPYQQGAPAGRLPLPRPRSTPSSSTATLRRRRARGNGTVVAVVCVVVVAGVAYAVVRKRKASTVGVRRGRDDET